MVGVTIGVGALHSKLSNLAAACFTECTGLPAVCLGSEDQSKSRLRHPSALRLKAFDFVDADSIVFFDADWFCLRTWTPRAQAGRPEVVACRDFVLEDEWPLQIYDYRSSQFLEPPEQGMAEGVMRHDYIKDVSVFARLHTPPSRWINCGLMVLNREYHSPLLREALQLYLGGVGHHPLYFEQPAIMKALELCNIRVSLLARRFNVLAAFPAKWPRAVIGLHVKVKRHAAFVHEVIAGTIDTRAKVAAYFA